MKLVSVVLSMFIVLFTMMMTACDSTTNGGSNDQDTLIVSQDDYTPSSDSSVCDKCEDGQSNEDSKTPYGTCGDGHCNIVGTTVFEDCNVCPEDCGCWNGMVCEDDGKCYDNPALADYYWLVGQWRRESVDGFTDGTIVDVTVEAWDDDLGAEVHGILPFNVSYIKKNPETDEFNFFSLKEKDGSYGEGKANQETLTLEFEYHNIPVGKTYHSIYIKL